MQSTPVAVRPANQPVEEVRSGRGSCAFSSFDVTFVVEHLAVPDGEHDRVVVDVAVVVELDDAGDSGELFRCRILRGPSGSRTWSYAVAWLTVQITTRIAS